MQVRFFSDLLSNTQLTFKRGPTKAVPHALQFSKHLNRRSQMGMELTTKVVWFDLNDSVNDLTFSDYKGAFPGWKIGIWQRSEGIFFKYMNAMEMSGGKESFQRFDFLLDKEMCFLLVWGQWKIIQKCFPPCDLKNLKSNRWLCPDCAHRFGTFRLATAKWPCQNRVANKTNWSEKMFIVNMAKVFNL